MLLCRIFIVIICSGCVFIVSYRDSTEEAQGEKKAREIRSALRAVAAAVVTTILSLALEDIWNYKQVKDEESKAISIDTETITNKTEETEAEETKEIRKIVAVDPGCVGCSFDASAEEPVGPNSSETSRAYTNGGIGPINGTKEYEVNLGVGITLRNVLQERGYEVVMTREDNNTLSSSKERAELAYGSGADIFVRIFCRQDKSGTSGAMVYLPSDINPYIGYMYEECNLLGNMILSNYCAVTGFENAGIKYTDVTKGINWSKIPVAQVMIGCITNPEDELKLANEGNWRTMAEGVANGIDDYFEEMEEKVNS